MAKNNLFIGNASGKIGDVVLYTSRGQQIARRYNPSPHNPQSPAQLLQRVVLKTSSLGYSFLLAICDHSFQGYAPGTESQSRFTQLNVAQMRLQLADYINSGDPEEILSCAESNFAASDASLPEMMPYIVSDGSLPQLNVGFIGNNTYAYGKLDPGQGTLSAATTYADICELFGLVAGDQLTFLALSCDDTEAGAQSKFNGFRYARVILSPSDGDMTSTFLAEGGGINKPNPRNEGDVSISFNANTIQFALGYIEVGSETANSLAAVAVIVSRWSGSVWQRSRAQLVLRPYAGPDTWRLRWDHGEDYMADAIASYQRDAGRSTRYLNQAGADF